MAEQAAPPEDVEITRDLVSGTGGGRDLHLHLVRPKGIAPGTRLPAVMYIHGGFWMGGTRDRGLDFLPALARRGYVGATIEYRLSQEAIFPAQIEDCKTAVRFLRAHADEHGIDPQHIGVWGGSAGGHLAALMGTSGSLAALEGAGGWAEQSSSVQAVVDAYGPTDLLQANADYSGPRGTDGNIALPDQPESPESRLVGGPVQEHKDLANLANPITHIKAGCPPFLIIHGTADALVHYRQSELLHAALQRAGVESELLMYPEKGHMHLDEDGLAKVYAFFDKHLKPS
ncbi:MAG TPA: alpha/beta hydrolase [Dehalococcoidia bacterium]|nr:alpha/beta hydrolase [Dehalococcoidia bacterium]